jgi:hypothetical protein
MAKIKKKIVLRNCNYEAQAYCFKKGFIIYPELSGNKYKVRYSRGSFGKYYMDGKEFNNQQAFQAIWDLYTKIYNHDKNK